MTIGRVTKKTVAWFFGAVILALFVARTVYGPDYMQWAYLAKQQMQIGAPAGYVRTAFRFRSIPTGEVPREIASISNEWIIDFPARSIAVSRGVSGDISGSIFRTVSFSVNTETLEVTPHGRMPKLELPLMRLLIHLSNGSLQSEALQLNLDKHNCWSEVDWNTLLKTKPNRFTGKLFNTRIRMHYFGWQVAIWVVRDSKVPASFFCDAVQMYLEKQTVKVDDVRFVLRDNR
jgi:hypothetical protein